MNQEPQARLINFGRPPKGERRVRFADTMGMELVSIFLFELINEYIHHQHNRTRKSQIKAISHNSHHGYHSSNYTTDNTILKSGSSASTTSSNHIHNNNNICYSNYNHYSHSHHDSSRAHTASRPSLSSSSSSASASSSSAPTTAATATAGPYYSSAPVSPAAPALAPPPPQSSAVSPSPSFTCEFTQPVSLLSFNERVKLNKVHLETCQINSTAGRVSVSCTIRVLNLSYDKSVIVRYTTDDWRTHADSLASFKSGTSDGWSDRFGATFTVTDQLGCLKPGQRIIFAIRCEFDGGSTHWDNNGGLNYAIRTSLSGR